MLAKKKTKEKYVIDLMLDQIDFHGMTAEENGLLKQLTSRFYSRALEAEMDTHLGYKKNDNSGDNSGNSRNGYTSKTVILENNDTIDVQVPRDRNSTFEPVIIPKHEKRTPLFNDQIISMYSFYTTNTIESLNFSLRKVTKNKSSFPDDDSIYKIMYLAIKNASTRWTMPIKDWALVVNQFAILFDGRVPVFN